MPDWALGAGPGTVLGGGARKAASPQLLEIPREVLQDSEGVP